jgi:branched-subunit amino acid transport protein
MSSSVFVAIVTMAVVTYLIRAIPLVLVRGKIRSRFVQSFLYYIPYTVLTAMTFPAILFCTPHLASALAGLLAALVLAFCRKGLMTVAAASVAAVLIVEGMIRFL